MADERDENSDEEEIKSSTLIKFAKNPQPRLFTTLPAAVDLKQPPSNW